METEIFQSIQAGPHWDWRVALDLFLGGAGVGSLIMAFLIDERFGGRYRRLSSTAVWLAPLLISAGLILILMKLGRPSLLLLPYTTVNVTSPLWWGGVFQPLLVIGSLIYALRWNNYSEADRSRIVLGRVLVPFAIIVGAYHGLLLSVMVARPLWNTGPTVVAALLGFASTGIAVVMLVHLIRLKIGGFLNDSGVVSTMLNDLKPVRNTLVAVLFLQLGTYFIWWLSLRLGSLHDQEALHAASGEFGYLFWIMGIGIGIILPICLGTYAVLKGETTQPTMRIGIIATASLMILVGGFYFRLLQTLGGQIQVASNTLF